MDRFPRLVELLRGRERVTLAELAERLGVTERTVRRDVARAAEHDIELDVRPGRGGGVRLVRDGSLPALRFTDDEALVLALALGAAGGDPRLARPARSARTRLARVLTEMYDEQLAALADVAGPQDLLGRDDVSARELFALCLATARRHRVEIDYVSPAGTRTRRPLDPFAVLPMAGHWYVTGWCGLRRAVRTFRVDRVRSVAESDLHIVVPDDFDAAETVAAAIRRSGRDDLHCTFRLATDVATARSLAPTYRLEVAADGDASQGVVGTIRAAPEHLTQIALMLLEFESVRGIAVTDVEPAALRSALTDLAQLARRQCEAAGG